MKSNLGANILYQIIYQMLILILPVATSPYISRILGAEQLGIYSYTYSIAYYFALVAALGINNHGSRVIAEAKHDKKRLNQVFSDLFTLHALIAIIVFAIYIFYLFFIFQEVKVKIYLAIQIFYVLSVFFDINWLFFGLEQFKITVTRNMIVKIITVLSIFIFIKEETDLWKYCFIMSFGFLVSQSVVWMFVKKYVSFVKPKWDGMKKNIIPMIILFVPTVAVSLYKIMDKIMLGNMSVKAEVGYYENSEKIINMLVGVITAVGTVMLPKMSSLVSKGEKKLVEYYMSLSIKLVICFSIALSFGLVAIAFQFSTAFFGEKFAECGYLIMILACSVPFIAFANVIRTQYLIPNHRDKLYLVSVMAGALVNIIINVYLIPIMKARGAAVGTVCAEATVCMIQTFAVSKSINLRQYVRYFNTFLLFGIIMCFCVHWTIDIIEPPLVGLFLGTVEGIFIYTVMAVIYMVAIKDDVWQLVKSKVKGYWK